MPQILKILDLKDYLLFPKRIAQMDLTFPQIKLLASCQLIRIQQAIYCIDAQMNCLKETKNIICRQNMAYRGRGWNFVNGSHLFHSYKIPNVQTKDFFRWNKEVGRKRISLPKSGPQIKITRRLSTHRNRSFRSTDTLFNKRDPISAKAKKSQHLKQKRGPI